MIFGAINGTDFINNPWNTTFKCFTDLFDQTLGNGMVFFLIPLIALTIGIQIKTRNIMITSLFMISSGALLASGSLFTNAGHMAIIFTIFAAIGFVGMIAGIIFQRG